MKPIRVGMIGYGGIGRVHGMGYRSIPFHYALPADSVQVVGVATTRTETAEPAAKELGCRFFTDDYRQLLDRDDIDMVDICTPNDSHEEIVVAAAQAGKHIYCEKPLAMNAEQGRRMVAAAEAAGVKTQMTFHFRFFPALMRARQLMDEGFVGRVFSFRGRYNRSSYISYDKPMSWRLRAEVGGSGALGDLGSHILDLLYYLLGDYGEVNTTLETLIKERPVSKGATEKAPVDVDDIALMNVRLADGTLGQVETSRMGTGATNDLIVEIFGDKGAIRFNLDDAAHLEVYDTRDDATPTGGMSGFRKVQTGGHYDGQRAPDATMTPGFSRAHAECQYQLLKAIWEDTNPSPTLAEGQHIQEVIEAAVLSSKESRWVKLDEVGG